MNILSVFCQLIFYAAGFLFLWREVNWFCSPKEELEKVRIAEQDLKSIEDLDPEYKTYIGGLIIKKHIHIYLLEIGYLIWAILGAFTDYYYLFAGIFLMTLIGRYVEKKIVKEDSRMVWERIDAGICTLLIAGVLTGKLFSIM